MPSRRIAKRQATSEAVFHPFGLVFLLASISMAQLERSSHITERDESNDNSLRKDSILNLFQPALCIYQAQPDS